MMIKMEMQFQLSACAFGLSVISPHRYISVISKEMLLQTSSDAGI